MGTTRVTVIARYEVEYDGQVTEDDIDINDVLRDPNALTDIKVTTKDYRGPFHFIAGGRVA